MDGGVMGIKIARVGHVVLKDSDLDRALDFYCGALGLTEVARGDFGDDIETLRAAKRHLEASGVPIQWIADHRVTQSIYGADPDGNNIELYFDADPSVWAESEWRRAGG
jgi:catechol 2,3-dioxygenase